MPEPRPEAVDMNVAVLLETVQGEKRVGQGIVLTIGGGNMVREYYVK